MKRRLLELVMIGAVSFSMACGTSSTGKGDQPPTETEIPTSRIELDPMLIQVGASPEEARTLNADDVFDDAFKAYQARRYEEAVHHYATLIKYFPESRFILPSLFNSGLAYEKLGRWDEASASYKVILAQFPKKRDARDAYFRLANVLEQLEEHEAIVELMTQAMLRPDITHFDRCEAHVRRSMALLELGSYDEAEEGFRTMLRLNKDSGVQQRLAENAHFVVQSHFGLGRALHAQVMATPLVLPPEKMGEDLQAKAELFLSAQSAYIRALRVHHPKWSVASGYMIGRLYEDFYLSIFSAEIPDDLTEEQLVLYFDELRKQLKPLMVRAIQVYEKNLSLSRRIDVEYDHNTWREATDVHLERLKAYLDDPFTQRRAERLVMQGRPLHELWNPRLMASDAVVDALERAVKASTEGPAQGEASTEDADTPES
ncbi:MAG: tetratricopeptide repeat protein [Myxococcota bacterium]